MPSAAPAGARVLVLGATGMLGHRVVHAFAAAYDVHASVRDVALAKRAELPGALHRLQADDSAALDALLGRVAPAVVVNCVGIVKQRQEAARPVPAIRVNALFPHELAEACERQGARLIHISTDCVFSGLLPPPAAYTEDDVPDARDLYGRTKLLGELDAPDLTLRTSIIGPELHRGSGLLEWFRRQAGSEVEGYRNAWFSGLTTDALAAVIVQVAREHPDLAGEHHVSADAISKYDLLLALRAVLEVPCTVVGVDEPRINRVLDSSRFRQATGIAIPSWDEMLSVYRKESHVQTA